MQVDIFKQVDKYGTFTLYGAVFQPAYSSALISQQVFRLLSNPQVLGNWAKQIKLTQESDNIGEVQAELEENELIDMLTKVYQSNPSDERNRLYKEIGGKFIKFEALLSQCIQRSITKF